MNKARGGTGSMLVFAALYIAATLIFIQKAEGLRVAHGMLVYLLLIVGAAATTGRLFAAAMVVAGYLAVDWLFIPPIGALGVPRILDGILLAGFVCVGFVVSELLVRYRNASERAAQRLAEIEWLSDEQRRMATELARANARQEGELAKNILLATVVHDLRTPIAAIQLQALRTSDAAPIAAEAVRLTGYLDALVTFVGDDRTMGPRHVANAAADLVASAVRAAGATLQGHRLAVRTPPDDGLLLGDFDLALAQRALVSLLENAGRQSPPDGDVEVELAWRDARLSVSVLDRGPELAPAEVAKLFAPLERDDAESATAGMGPGLAIVRTFARAQGGDLAYAQRAGGGSAFTLELPARRT